jgi:hypothetical protein
MRYSTVLAADPDHEEARRGMAEAEKGRKLSQMSEEEMMAAAQAMSMHSELGLEQAEVPGDRWVDHTGRNGVGAVAPSLPTEHPEGNGSTYLRFTVRLPTRAASAGEQAFEVQAGPR